MRLTKLCSCPHSAQVVLEDLEGTVHISFRLPQVMALLLTHVVEHTHCPGFPAYHLIQELLRELGGDLCQAIIDASQDGTPVGLLVIRREGREIRLPCHPVDAIAMALRTQVPLYTTPRALEIGGLEDPRPWLEMVKPEDFC